MIQFFNCNIFFFIFLYKIAIIDTQKTQLPCIIIERNINNNKNNFT